MSDILCDVCGTSYPETDTQCPICGTAKSDSATVEGLNSQETTGYAYVRGGRFSQSNVRKRNGGKEPARVVAPVKPAKETPPAEPVKPKKAKKEKAQPPVVQEPAVVPVETPAPQPVYQQPQQIYQAPQPVYQQPYQAPQPVYSQPNAPRRKKQNKKKGSVIGNVILLVIVILLVAAIVAACAYLAIKLARMYVDPAAFGGTTTSQTSPSNSSSTNRPADILCSEIQLSIPSYTFTSIGQTLLLQVTKLPANTTEQVTFESSDPYIASVDAEGRVVAVAKGTAVITVRCGQAEAKTCEIVCNLPNDPAYPTQPPATTIPPTSTTKPFVELVLNRNPDFTLFGFGDSHNLYSGPLDPAAITWTSSDEDVAKVENGIVTAVGNGNAVIKAEYEGQTAICRVICKNVVKGSFRLSIKDTTIRVGGTIIIKAYLTDENGQDVLDENGNMIQIDPAELKFYVTDAEGFLSVDEYGTVTAIKNNWAYLEKYKYVYVEYNGVVLNCIVRVKDA